MTEEQSQFSTDFSITSIVSDPSLSKRLGIFGGSFDPIHDAHIELAMLAKSLLKLSSVVFIPANRNPLKASAPVASNKARLEMLSLALKDQEGLFVSDLECKENSGLSYSVATLKSIHAGNFNKKNELFFLIGTDQIQNLHLWRDYKELFKLAQIVVFGRDGISPGQFASINQNLNESEIKVLKANYIEFSFSISSTEIREAFANQEFERLRSFIPESVFEYIQKSNIYTRQIAN
jgi:nicotinate-nucleotide adenylyltransferase